MIAKTLRIINRYSIALVLLAGLIVIPTITRAADDHMLMATVSPDNIVHFTYVAPVNEVDQIVVRDSSGNIVGISSPYPNATGKVAGDFPLMKTPAAGPLVVSLVSSAQSNLIRTQSTLMECSQSASQHASMIAMPGYDFVSAMSLPNIIFFTYNSATNSPVQVVAYDSKGAVAGASKPMKDMTGEVTDMLLLSDKRAPGPVTVAVTSLNGNMIVAQEGLQGNCSDTSNIDLSNLALTATTDGNGLVDYTGTGLPGLPIQIALFNGNGDLLGISVPLLGIDGKISGSLPVVGNVLNGLSVSAIAGSTDLSKNPLLKVAVGNGSAPTPTTAPAGSLLGLNVNVKAPQLANVNVTGTVDTPVQVILRNADGSIAGFSQQITSATSKAQPLTLVNNILPGKLELAVNSAALGIPVKADVKVTNTSGLDISAVAIAGSGPNPIDVKVDVPVLSNVSANPTQTSTTGSTTNTVTNTVNNTVNGAATTVGNVVTTTTNTVNNTVNGAATTVGNVVTTTTNTVTSATKNLGK